jgi:hypothetical protein
MTARSIVRELVQGVIGEANKHTYEVIGAGVDHTGWFKIWLRRDDGKEMKVSRKRVADLRREGRVTTADKTFGDLRSLPRTN